MAMDKDGNIVVGFAGISSGWLAAYSGPATEAGMIAIDDINARGGLLGKKLVAIFSDAKRPTASRVRRPARPSSTRAPIS